MQDLLIFGLSPLASMAYHQARQEQERTVKGFVVDEKYRHDPVFHNLPVYAWENIKSHYHPENSVFFSALGYRSLRAKQLTYNRIAAAGYTMCNLYHHSCSIADDVVIGQNNIIMAGVVIEPGCHIGNDNVFWSNTTLCHDSQVGDHNFMAANTTFGGGSQIGDMNFFGFSSTMLQHLNIGYETLIGAQSLVTRNTENLSCYLGIPARKIRALDAHIGVTVS